MNIRVTAANRHGDEQKHFPVPKVVHAAKPGGLVDVETGRLRRDAHITPLLELYMRDKAYAKFEVDDRDWEA